MIPPAKRAEPRPNRQSYFIEQPLPCYRKSDPLLPNIFVQPTAPVQFFDTLLHIGVAEILLETFPSVDRRSATLMIVQAELVLPGMYGGILRYGGDSTIEAAAANGMDDFIRLPVSTTEMLYRVLHQYRRLCRSIAVAASPPGDSIDLSLQGEMLLYVLRKNRGKVVERAVLAEILNVKDSSRSVDMCISRLRRKLRDCGCRENIHAVRGVGYRLGAGDGK